MGGDKIGWFPSFPFTVRVVDPLHPDAGRTDPQSAVSRPVERDGEPITRGGKTAAKVNLWGVSLWDFAWTSGESLTSKPARGTDRNGWWLDSSDGSGRVGPGQRTGRARQRPQLPRHRRLRYDAGDAA